MDGEQDNQQPSVNGADDNGNHVDNPPADQPPPSLTLNVTMRHQMGQELTFKMKDTTKMGKAMDAFSARLERDVKTLRFLVEGFRFHRDATLKSLEIDDDCLVDVFEEQIGGGT